MKTKVSNLLNKYIKNLREINYYKVFFIILCIFLTYYVSRYIFSPLNFYSDYAQLDIFIHIIGGFLFVSLFINLFKNRYINFRNILLLILIIGVFWEILEFLLGATNLTLVSTRINTLKDLFMDILGAYLAFVLYKKK